MSERRRGRRPRGGAASGHDTLAQDTLALAAPTGLEAYPFVVEGQEYAVLSFALRDVVYPEALTPAEREVTEGVVRGLSTAAIARERGTSARTVANQLRKIYEKLRLSGRVELVRRCTEA